MMSAIEVKPPVFGLEGGRRWAKRAQLKHMMLESLRGGENPWVVFPDKRIRVAELLGVRPWVGPI